MGKKSGAGAGKNLAGSPALYFTVGFALLFSQMTNVFKSITLFLFYSWVGSIELGPAASLQQGQLQRSRRQIQADQAYKSIQ